MPMHRRTKGEIVKKLFVVAALGGVVLAGCGGVDREGTRDLFVKQIEATGAKVDGSCVDDALDEYSDDELKKFNDDMSSPEAQELTQQLVSCVTP
jgi:hypothetical protein